MIEQQVVEQPLGQVGPAHRLGKALADQQGLRGMLEDDAVARHQRRNDGIHRRQVGIVPGRDHQHRAHRLALDQAAKACDRLRRKRRQGLGGDGDHVAGTLFEPAQLASAITHGPAHLPGQLRYDIGLHGQHRVHHGAAYGGAFTHWPAFPLGLCVDRCGQCLLDSVGIGIGTFSVDPAINR
ncbi:hypothetical protein D3C76_1132520 [compost metagenome]